MAPFEDAIRALLGARFVTGTDPPRT